MSNEEILQYHLNSGKYKSREESFKAKDLDCLLEHILDVESEYRKRGEYFVSELRIINDYYYSFYTIWELRKTT